jgi:hypothetical protein
MHRRYFLGLALSAMATPALARKKQDQPRVLSFHHLHTDEKITLAYRIGDRYQRSALHTLNHFLRDYRTDDVTVMDPQLFDLLYDINHRLGDPEGVFEIVCGYRCPSTNAQLYRRSRGVAKHSLHLTEMPLPERSATPHWFLVEEASVTTRNLISSMSIRVRFGAGAPKGNSNAEIPLVAHNASVCSRKRNESVQTSAY